MQNSAESLDTADAADIQHIDQHIEKLWTETALGEKPYLDWERNQAESADCAALPAPFDGNSFVMSANALKRYAASLQTGIVQARASH